MQSQIQTYIIRHKKENLKKCSLNHLETREDCAFFKYPLQTPPQLSGKFVWLTLGAPILSTDDHDAGLILLDATWRYADDMAKNLKPWLSHFEPRQLPTHFRTAYPRKQTGCHEPEKGLASIEALYISYHLMGRSTKGLLDHYYWKDSFLALNPELI